MSDLKKLTGITGLNTAHPLYSAVDRLLNFDTAITDVKSGSTYTSTGVLVDDPDLGLCREIDANADATTPNLSVPFNSTVLMIYKPTGANTAGSASVAFYLNLNAGGNALMFEAGNYSGYDYRLQFRGSSSAVFTIQYVPYKTNGSGGVTIDQTLILSRKNQAHATAFDFKPGDAGSLYQNGLPVARYFQSATPSFTPSANPLSVPMTNSTAAAAAYRMSAIIVFNRVLTDEEKASVTNDPWDLVVGALPLEVSLSAALTPGATITATLTNYPSLPTSVTITDSRGNDIVRPLTATGATTATFTAPALVSSNAGQDYIQFGAVNLAFGAKVISSTFNPVSPLSYVNLVAPVATTAFEAWGSDVPVANEQLTSESNFDVNGNFTGADPDATYTCWITRLDGTNHRFTVRQGSAGPGPETVATPVITPESGTYSNSVTVAITTATSGAAIRYTTNGSDVTSGSTLYSAPFSVTDDATVKARGFKDGMTDSAQASQTYVINSTAITGVDELSPWQPEYTHAIRINQIIDSAGLSVAKVSVQQQEYIYALKVNEIITALNLPIKRLSVQQPGYMTALTINAIISAVESTVYE